MAADWAFPRQREPSGGAAAPGRGGGQVPVARRGNPGRPPAAPRSRRESGVLPPLDGHADGAFGPTPAASAHHLPGAGAGVERSPQLLVMSVMSSEKPATFRDHA